MSWDDDDWESSVNLGGVEETAPAETFSDEEEVVDDEDDGAAVEKPKPKKKVDDGKIKAKALSKQKQKDLEKEMEQAREEAKSLKPMSKEEKIAEKARLQKLVEDQEVAQMAEMFQIKKEESKGVNVDALAALLQNVPLRDEGEFKNLAEAVATRVEIEDKPHLAKDFVKELCRLVGRSLGGEDLAEVISVLGVVKNEKVKAQLNKKKKKVNKKFAKVQRDDFDLDGSSRGVGGGFGANEYDDIDGDFM